MTNETSLQHAGKLCSQIINLALKDVFKQKMLLNKSFFKSNPLLLDHKSSLKVTLGHAILT